jgi:hypothetical protein
LVASKIFFKDPDQYKVDVAGLIPATPTQNIINVICWYIDYLLYFC